MGDRHCWPSSLADDAQLPRRADDHGDRALRIGAMDLKTGLPEQGECGCLRMAVVIALPHRDDGLSSGERSDQLRILLRRAVIG